MHQTKFEIWLKIAEMTVGEVRLALEFEPGERRFEATNLFKPPLGDTPTFVKAAIEIGGSIQNVARCASVSEPRRLKLSNLANSFALPLCEVARMYGADESFDISKQTSILTDAIEVSVQVLIKHSMYQFAEVLEALNDGLQTRDEIKVGNCLRTLDAVIQANNQRALRAA